MLKRLNWCAVRLYVKFCCVKNNNETHTVVSVGIKCISTHCQYVCVICGSTLQTYFSPQHLRVLFSAA